ncbi:MAG: 3-oxoacyl-ACP reductase FabG [Anaerolineae bacterium]|nr:3-oxoacyl-ACP reductase FabG [Anaerolineae bacterium]
MRVDDKVAIVTGSGTGLGQAFSWALAQAGADVVVTELPGKESQAEATAAEVRAAGRRAMTVTLDVTQLSAIQAMVDRVVGEWGHIDILVNNAGINIPKWAVEMTEEAWDKVVDTDLKGTFFCAQAVGKHIIARGGGGKIINVASIMGVVGYYYRAHYASAKAGVVNMTRVLAIEWAPHNIQVNAVAPGYVNTPLTKPMFEKREFYEEVVRRIPLNRVGEPQDIAGAVVFLASPAADYVTGHTLLVDGGWTAW